MHGIQTQDIKKLLFKEIVSELLYVMLFMEELHVYSPASDNLRKEKESTPPTDDSTLWSPSLFH